jgi:hypothetical protein
MSRPFEFRGRGLAWEIYRDQIIFLTRSPLFLKRNLHVPIISFDGQWYRVLVRDSNGYPLTQLQLQEDVFVEAKKTSKSEIINYIMSANMIQNLDVCLY